jgi:hypothetical protein
MPATGMNDSGGHSNCCRGKDIFTLFTELVAGGMVLKDLFYKIVYIVYGKKEIKVAPGINIGSAGLNSSGPAILP